MTAITQHFARARKSARGIALDLVTPTLAALGLLATTCAVITAHDSPRAFRAWAAIIAAGVLIAAAETGYVLLFFRALRRGRRVRADLAQVRAADFDAAAIKVAVAVLDWTDEQRAAYRELVEQTPDLALARLGLRQAFSRTGRLDAGMRAIADQLTASSGGLYASDVFLAVLATDLVGYRDWEALTRWWRAVDLHPALPLHPGRPKQAAA